MVARGQGEGDKARDRAECDGGYGMTAQGSVRMWIPKRSTIEEPSVSAVPMYSTRS